MVFLKLYGAMALGLGLLVAARTAVARWAPLRNPWRYLDALTLALVAGEIANGLHRARGFSPALFAAGVAPVALLHAVRFSPRLRRRVVELARRLADRVGRNLTEPKMPPPSTRRLAARLLTAAAATAAAVALLLALRPIYRTASTDSFHYLEGLMDLGQRSSPWDRITLRECTSGYFYQPHAWLMSGLLSGSSLQRSIGAGRLGPWRPRGRPDVADPPPAASLSR